MVLATIFKMQWRIQFTFLEAYSWDQICLLSKCQVLWSCTSSFSIKAYTLPGFLLASKYDFHTLGSISSVVHGDRCQVPPEWVADCVRVVGLRLWVGWWPGLGSKNWKRKRELTKVRYGLSPLSYPSPCVLDATSLFKVLHNLQAIQMRWRREEDVTFIEHLLCSRDFHWYHLILSEIKWGKYLFLLW